MMLDQQAQAASSALPRGGALSAVRTAKKAPPPSSPTSGGGLLGDWTQRLLGKSNRLSSSSHRSGAPASGGGPIAEGVMATMMTASGSPKAMCDVAGIFSPVRKGSSSLQSGGAEIAEAAEAEVSGGEKRMSSKHVGVGTGVQRVRGGEERGGEASQSGLCRAGMWNLGAGGSEVWGVFRISRV